MPKATVGDVTLDYELRGQGPPLLMVPGFRRSRMIWREPLLRALEPHFTMVLPDNRGTGHSDKPEGGYRIEQFADDDAALLEALGIERAHYFGVSMGGMIGQRLALRHPERVWGLALGCTHFGGEGVVPAEREIWNLLRLQPGADMDARQVAREQERAYFTDAYREANRAANDELFDDYMKAPSPPHAIKGHLAAIEAFDAGADLGRIAAPTLVMTGREDRLIVPENSRLLAERIPGARLVELPDAAHFFWIEKAEATARTLTDFFNSLPGE